MNSEKTPFSVRKVVVRGKEYTVSSYYSTTSTDTLEDVLRRYLQRVSDREDT
jgi:hypothetical protein